MLAPVPTGDNLALGSSVHPHRAVQFCGASSLSLYPSVPRIAFPDLFNIAIVGRMSRFFNSLLSDRAALRVTVGHIEARSKSGNHFTANSLNFGFDYLFSLPTW